MKRSTCRIQAVIFDLDDTLLDCSQQTDWLSNIGGPHLANVHDYLLARVEAVPERDIFFNITMTALQPVG